MEVLASI